ncbi:hypothetical protein [Pontibacillus yanchengensis]|uniref:Uncharacterized protein n=1 Tax=Pontibacillus yanchengensis Y32 TaxID=1385514 RepID=A0A0A2TE01_9BACI|nr:hypothetical protein [Pontibacillus yanchengensis]KGP74072.1 hypothetical protein N782_17185 [Pontibacillus yanchengensis Y32]
MDCPSPNFFIGTIRIGTVEGASCVNFGNNAPSHFESYKKHSQGFGSITGDGNKTEGVRSLLQDAAFMDMMTNQGPKSEQPEWVQQWMKKKMEEEHD